MTDAAESLMAARRAYYNEPIMFDPSKLEWRDGHPSHDGTTWLRWGAWVDRWEETTAGWVKHEDLVARLETAIVYDVVDLLIHDGKGTTWYDKLTTMYRYVNVAAHVPTRGGMRAGTTEMHHPYVAARIVRVSDGAIVASSLTSGEYHRVMSSDNAVSFWWGPTLREARYRREIPGKAW